MSQLFVRHRRRMLAGFVVLLGLLLLLPMLTSGRQGGADGGDALAQAWELARASGSYDFRSSVDQETTPALSLRTSGRPPRHDYLTLRGRIDQPAERMSLSLWRSRSTNPANAVELRVDGMRAEGRVGTGEWEPVELDTMTFAPGGDPLGFLASATNVSAGPVDVRTIGAVELRYTPYSFAVSGAAFGRYLQEQAIPRLRKQGKLPPWLNADLTNTYSELAGSGTLWLDQDGLPARMELNLQLPAPDAKGSVKAKIVSDFSNFDTQRLALASSSFFANPDGWLSYHLTTYQPQLQTIAWYLLGLLALLGLAWFCVRSWRRPRFYAGTVLLVIASMLLTPLFQGQQAAVLAAEQQALVQEQQEQSETIEAREQALASISEPSIDPHVGVVGGRVPGADMATTGDLSHNDCRDGACPVSTDDPPASTVGPQASPLLATADNTDITDDTDSDGDGLSDADEASWASCPSASSTSEDCEGVDDPTDSDGDGLSDGLEVHSIGTLPTTWDSDSDGLTDTLELNGFSYGGKTWYLDPGNDDTNKDSVLDSIECPVWLATSDDFNPAAACPDTDSDGTPDVWDDDNDNDGLHDAVDLDTTSSSTTYDADHPLSLTVTDLQPNLPVFVDLQVVPSDAGHLEYFGSVLDWPTGDSEGQIKRRLDTTWATTENSELYSDDENAGNGDIRFVPMIEITVPFDGRYANLPVKSAYQNVPRTQSMRVDDWLDTSELDPYSVAVRDADETSGDLVIYVPLAAQEDEVTGKRTAFVGRMLYWPNESSASVVDWGSAHEYRVIWMVQMITDICTDDNDISTCSDTLQVVHIYDETWKLASMTVREDHGLDINILYEDPAQESAEERLSEDDLWAAAWNLDSIWLRGRDCDLWTGSDCQGDANRDVTMDTMESMIDSWSGGDAIEAITRNYTHEGYLSHIMMTETVSLLEETFTSAGMTQTMLLFAYEETYRSGTLGSSTMSGYNISVPMTETLAPEIVQASMSWTRYQEDGGSWAVIDATEDIELLTEELKEDEYFTEAGSESLDEAEGKIIAIQAYYLSLLSGVSSIVEIDGATTWVQSPSSEITEDFYASAWPASITAGAAYTAFAIKDMIVPALKAIRTGQGFFETLRKSYGRSQTTQSFRLNGDLKAGKQASKSVMTSMILMTVMGSALFAAGYFTGDAALQDAGETMLALTTVVASATWSLNILVTMRSVQRSASGIMYLDDLAGVAKSNRAVGGAGLILALAFTWGFFLISASSSGLLNRTGSIEFNTALAYSIATTIVAIILFFIDLIPVIGPLIVCLIYIIDGLITVFCNDCKGIQTLMTEGIARLLYDVDTVVEDFDNTDRLDFAFSEVTMLDDEAGFSTSQSITLTMAVTSTIKRHDNVSDGNAKETTLRYYLQQEQAPQHEDLGPGDMKDEWYSIGGPKIRTNTSTTWLGDPITFKSVGAGINRSLTKRVYFTESYALPYRGCWLAFGINANCNNWESTNGTWWTDVGQYQVFDILPATIEEFYAMDWGNNQELEFPTVIDHDGDGLTNTTDPDEQSWDSDNDGLSDYYELTNGYSPADSDSDDDGMNDHDELRRGFNVVNGDSDDDGLTDQQEWQGWRIAYQVVNKVPSYMWVWSNPYSADADQDGLTDLEEYYYGLNPWVETDYSEILKTITFDESTIAETSSPRLLMRFEEGQGEQIFDDDSGQQLQARCAGTSCPTAGGLGRYAGGLSFDGNDYLSVEQSMDLSRYTQALWVYPTSTSSGFQGLLGYQSGGTATRAPSLWINQQNRLHGGFGTGTSWLPFNTGSVLTLNSWNHVAVSFDGTMLAVYVNATEVYSTSTIFAGKLPYAVSQLTIGKVDSSFTGKLDDVAVYDYALSAAQVQKLMQGSYNPDDLMVTTGDTLETSLTLNNNSPNWPAAVTYYGDVDEDFSGYEEIEPYAHFTFDEASGATSFANTGDDSNAATCESAESTCPTAGVAGYRNGAIELEEPDLVNLYPSFSAADSSRFQYSTAIGMWIYPTSIQGQQHIYTMHLDNPELGSTNPEVVTHLQYSTSSNPNWASQETIANEAGRSAKNALPLNTWSHVMVVYDWVSYVSYVFVNGETVLADRFTSTSDSASRGFKGYYLKDARYLQLGNTYYSSSHFGFGGKIDDLVMYDLPNISEQDVQRIMQGQKPLRLVEPETEVYSVPAMSSQQLSSSFSIPAISASGSFSFTHAAEAALDISDELGFNSTPLIRAHFDEPGWSSVYASGGSTAFSCSGSVCPTAATDIAGSAAVFDGVDDALSIPVSLSNAAWSIGAWIKPTASGTTRTIFGNRVDYTNGFPGLVMGSSQVLGLWVYTSSGWQSYSPSTTKLKLNEWQQVTLTFNGSSSFKIYLDGALYGTITATPLRPHVSPLYLGKVHASWDGFKGSMDNFTVYNVELSAGEVATLSSLTDLSLHARYTFDEPPGDSTFTDLAGVMGDAHCDSSSSCPALGIRGRVNHAALFDGNDLLTTSYIPTFWNKTITSLTFAGWMRVEHGIVFELLDSEPALSIWHNRLGLGNGPWGRYIPYSYAWYHTNSVNHIWANDSTTEWMHLAIVSDVSGTTNDVIYLNGVPTSLPFSAEEDDYLNGYPISIGSNLVGYVDDFSLYQRALSSSEVQALYQHSSPELELAFEEAAEKRSFADSSDNEYTATTATAQSGNLGRVGNGLTLDGSSVVTLTNASGLDSLSTSATVMAWIYPDSVSGEQIIYSSMSKSSSGSYKGFAFELKNNYLRLSGSDSVLSTSSVPADTWSHVAAVIRDSGKISFYIDGEAAGTSYLAGSVLPDSDGLVTVGARTYNGSSYQSYFDGTIDELNVYGRALTGSEIESAYLNQFRSFRKEHTARVTVDAEAPTISLLETQTHFANLPFQLTAVTSDTSSGVWAFDYSLQAANGSSYTSQPARPCDDSVGNSLWCISIDPAQLGGAGAYTVQFRAVDGVGNQATSASYTVYVDATGPQAASSYSNTWINLTADPQADLTWSVTLSGTVGDPVIALSSGTVAGSGVDPDAVKVALVDSSGATLDHGPFRASVSGTAWSVDYTIAGQRPSGTYSVQVTAADTLGNSTTASVGTVTMDAQPPLVELYSVGIAGDFMSSQTLNGIISELSTPSGALVDLHFAEASGASSFAASSSEAISASCSNCPSQTTGIYGYALQFDGSNDSLTVPATGSLDLSEATLSAWIKPSWSSGTKGYNPAILALRDSSNTRFSWHLRDNYSALEIYNGTTIGSVPVAITPNQWTHVAIVQSGDEWTAYVNGVVAGSASQSFSSASGLPLNIGSATTSSGFFQGALDEVQVFERALSESEIYKLAQQQINGISDVEVALEPFSFDESAVVSATWQAATVVVANSGQGTWSYQLPNGLEGFYEIKLRGNDVEGNLKQVGTVWRGAIDTTAPRITATAVYSGGLLSGHTRYTIEVEDLFMDISSLQHPDCASSSESYSYYDNPPLPEQLVFVCDAASLLQTAQAISICDYAGQCTTVSVTPSDADLSEVAIYNPAAGMTVEGTGELTIHGEAYIESDSIQSITLSVNGSTIAQNNYTQASAITRTTWSTPWTPPSIGSYSVQAVMIGWAGQRYTDTHSFQVIDAPLPGGVRYDLALWLDAADGLTVTSDGAAVGSWSDQAQGWQAQHTTNQSPTLALEAINFNPAISFGSGGASELSFGANYLTVPSGGEGLTIFAVAASDVASGTRSLLDQGAFGGKGLGLALSADSALGYVPQADITTTAELLQATPPSGSDATLLTYEVDFGAGSTLAINGEPVDSVANSQLSRLDGGNLNLSATHQSGSGPLTLGRQSDSANAGNYFKGDLAEVIVYTGTLTFDERRKVESYLALKYGLTLSDGTQPLSYTDALGSVIWDAAAQGDFSNNVTGIGRDDTSGLSQRKSRGAGAMLTIAHGALATPSAFSADRSFLIVGEDAGLITSTTTITNGTARYQRIERTWQVQTIGTVGSSTMAFELAGLGTTASNAWLLVSDDASFASYDIVEGTIKNGQALFTRSLSDGEYFTLAINRTEQLTVTLSTPRDGSVSSSPAGIESCTSSCSAWFLYNQEVSLRAMGSYQYVFNSWSGACTSINSNGCRITMSGPKSATASFKPNRFMVTATRNSGSGMGSVSSQPAGISCGGDCSEILDYASVITLTATPSGSSTFAGWSGACAGVQSTTCVLTVDSAANNAIANFSNPNGYAYGEANRVIPGTIQAEDYNEGGQGYGWYDSDTRNKGDSSYRSTGGVDMVSLGGGAYAVAWTEKGEWLKYTVSVAEPSFYKVSYRYSSIANSTSFSLLVDGVNAGKIFPMTKTASFYGVYQTNSVSGVYLSSGEHVITILFDQFLPGYIDWLSFERQNTLSLSKGGSGEGSVTSNEGSIACGETCAAPFELTTVVTLTATPSAGSSFAGWSGACSGSGSCSVTLDQARSVGASFTLNSYALNVVATGLASGTVTSTTSINCGATCSETLPYGTSVTLVATPQAGAVLQGWDGACAGTELTCMLTIDESNVVTATFGYRAELLIGSDGSGTGTITSTSGIVCADQCGELLYQGEQVTLTATPSAGSSFTGWSGDCAGSGSCVVTLDGSTQVTATFEISEYTLDINLDGGGSGTISINPGDITCTTNCSQTFQHGTQASLIVTPNPGSHFTGWSGDCAGKQECSITIDATRSVTATLIPCVTTITVTNGNDSGTGSLRNAINDACAATTIGFVSDMTVALESHIELLKGLTIDGGTRAVTISGDLVNGMYTDLRGGIFKIAADDTVTLRNLALVDGTAQHGGAIYAESDLVIEDSLIANNMVNGFGRGYGGGLYISGTLDLMIEGTTISGNDAYEYGGGLFVDIAGLAIISDTIISNNHSNSGGGGLKQEDGLLHLIGSSLSGNSAGGLVLDGGLLLMDESSITQNGGAFAGGGMDLKLGNASISSSEISGNSASWFGGGIKACGLETFTLIDTGIYSNTVGDGSSDSGAGIYLCASRTTISRSTFAYNSAGGTGGGLMIENYNIGGVPNTTIENSTFAHNHAGQWGGGLYIGTSDTRDTGMTRGTLTIGHSTFVDNTGSDSDGDNLAIEDDWEGMNDGVYVTLLGAIASLSNSIIAGSTCHAPRATIVNTLVEDGTCDFDNPGSVALSGDPMLSALGDNGGETLTMMPLPSSPAIDAGASASCLATDQRGVARTIGAACDLGATEYSGIYRLNVSVTGSGSVSSSPSNVIDCGGYPLAGDCSADLPVGTAITLTATALNNGGATGSFTGWGGDCSGTGDCTLSMNSPHTISASFCNAIQLVTNGNNSGPGSLRAAIEADGCALPIIRFAGDLTVGLTSPITISKDLTIDGETHAVTISGDLVSSTSLEGGILTISAGSAVTLTNLTFADGTAKNGGAIYNLGTLTVQESRFSNNVASSSLLNNGRGGAIYNKGALTVVDSDFSGNAAKLWGGAIMQAAGSSSISGSTFDNNNSENSTGGALSIIAGTATLAGSSFTNNQSRHGGAIFMDDTGQLSIVSSSFTNNLGNNGGAINLWGTATLTISNSEIISNTAWWSGGGIAVEESAVATIVNSTIANNIGNDLGAGIYQWGSSTKLSIINSTIAHNSGTSEGGGLYIEGGLLTISNSTFANNAADSRGGALFIDQYNPTVTITHTTLANNTASQAGGLFIRSGPTNSKVHMWNSIIADSSGGDCAGTLATNVQNMVEDGSCGPALSGDPMLSALGDYGGNTQTIGLLPGSPAIDAGAGASCLAADQRGVARPWGSGCDLGAFESRGFKLAITGGNQTALLNTAFATPLGIQLQPNASGEPVASVTISLSAPLSGASLLTPSLSLSTNAGGGLSLPIAANGLDGSYTVSVSAPGITGPVTVTLTNDAGRRLDVTKVGSGSVSSTPAGISCGVDCTELYGTGTSVTLTAVAATGYSFTGWSGACSGSGSCVVTMDQLRSVTATFTLNQYTLSVSKAGSGSGTVSSTPVGISCGADCSELFSHGTVVTLTASASAGSSFAGWSGACSGSGSCVVTMDQLRSVTGSFTLNQYSLSVSKAGSGSGTVSSMPVGISCGAECSGLFGHGTVVTLTASASAGSSFAGWSGACSGSGSCVVTMDQLRSVTASFALSQQMLTVTKAGTGSGTVSSSPAGISCGSTCSASFSAGQLVTLTAVAGSAARFSGWSGDCSGSGTTCQVTMSQARSVTASFTTHKVLLPMLRR